MPFRPLKSFFSTADQLLAQDLPTLGAVLLTHLQSYEGLNTVYQHAGVHRGYLRAMLENRNVGLGPLPKEAEYGIRQPEVTKRMMEAWNWLERQGVLIRNDEQVVKMVVASAVDEQGEEIYPRKWNNEFIDLPVVEKDKQNTPYFSAEVMTGLARWKKPRERMIFVLCGAAGLRIGEVLGIEIDKHIAPDFLTLYIKQKVRHGKVERRLKTANGFRQVDLHPTIAGLLQQFVGDRKAGFLFCTREEKPVSPTNILRRHLHKALMELKYVNPYTGTHKAGNHAFRRFRNTYLRNYTECPEGLYKYWMGHAGKDMSDLYDKIKEDVAFRIKWAERCGFGFELPSVVPNVPKTAEKAEAPKVA